ncbi:unnamed protein product [Phytomonas sp. EM1]|nr:unnamed protein product [Phytomonas sp. EM1]|eukprot:CCW60685.1 unnamed protein product [Phytomonas sp. isolate EM1]
MTLLKQVKINLGGGCELLFDNRSELVLEDSIPEGATLTGLVQYLKSNCLSERPDLFVNSTGMSVRPGILVLVDGCDAEIMGGMDYVLEEGDTVDFISTLHGG